jgi:outer membrane protein assembly factor BamB
MNFRKSSFPLGRASILVIAIVSLLAASSFLSTSFSGVKLTWIHQDFLQPANPSPSSPWNMFKHDLQRSGLSSYAAVLSNASLWDFNSRSVDRVNYYSSPVISSDGKTIYYASGSTLYAVNSSTGAQVWNYSLLDSATFEGSTPALASDGSIYIGATDSDLYAINYTGILEWSFNAGGNPIGGSSFYGQGIQSSPVVSTDGTIYFGSENGSLIALSPPSSGSSIPTLKWQYQIGQKPPNGYTCGVQVSCGIFISSPALSPTSSAVYIAGEDNNLYAVSPPSLPGSTRGVLLWNTTIGSVGNTPVLTPDGKTLYVTQESGLLYSINASSGVVNWKLGVGAFTGSPSLGSDGTIYAGGGQCVSAINPSGTEKWGSCGFGAYFDGSSPAVDKNGMVYAGSDSGTAVGLFAFRQSDGAVVWYYKTGSANYVDSSPAIDENGTVFFDDYGLSNGTLFAIGGVNSPKSEPSPVVNVNLTLAGATYGLAVDPATGRVFASTCTNPYPSIYVIDGSSNSGGTSNTVIDTISGIFQSGACLTAEAYDTTHGELYVLDYGHGDVLAINGTNYGLDKTIPIVYGSVYSQSMAFDSANGDLYVATGTNYTTVIDTSTKTVVADMGLPKYSVTDALAYDSANQDIYVATEGSGLNGFAILDGTTNTVINTVSLGNAPYLVGATFDPTNSGVYFSDINLDTIYKVNGSTVSPTVNSIPLVAIDHDYEAWAIAYASTNNNFYIAGYDTGSIPILNGTTNISPISIAVSPAWPTSAIFDPANGDVYVGSTNSVNLFVLFTTSSSSSSTSSTTTTTTSQSSSSSSSSSTTGYSIPLLEPVGLGDTPVNRLFTLFHLVLNETSGLSDNLAKTVYKLLHLTVVDTSNVGDIIASYFQFPFLNPVHRVVFIDPPAYFQVSAPGGKVIGYNPDGISENALGAKGTTSYNSTAQTEIVTIVSPSLGQYKIQVFGTSNGTVSITVETFGENNNNKLGSAVYQLSITKGSVTTLYANVGSTGAVSISNSSSNPIELWLELCAAAIVAIVVVTSTLMIRRSRHHQGSSIVSK